VDVLVVVGAIDLPQRLAVRARHLTHVADGDATPSLVAELRGRIPRDVGVLGSGPQATRLAVEPIDVTLEGDGLVFSGLKPAERGGGMVLRCFNATGQPTAGAWHFGTPVIGAHRARADERQLHEIRLGEGGRFVPFHAAPHEIVTIMVALGRSD